MEENKETDVWATEAREFEKYLDEQVGLSGTTPQDYATHIQRLEQPLNLKDFTGNNGDEKLDKFINMLEDEIKYTPVRSAFRHYIKWKKKTQNVGIPERKVVSLIINEIDDIDINDGSTLTENQVKRRVLSNPEVREVVNYIENELTASDFKGKERWHDEMKLVPLMIFESGCRVGELIGKQGKQEETGLRVKDLNRVEKTFDIIDGKGEKDRTASYKSDLLEKFMDKYDIEEPNEKVFTIPYSKFYYRLKKAGEETIGRGLRKGEKPLKSHDFRHTFATNWAQELLDNGLSYYEALEKIEDYFQHEEKDTTEIYVHVAQDFLEEGNIYTSGEKGQGTDFEVEL